MRLRFKHQKFQADAAKAVVDVFAGQPYLTPSYMMDRGNGFYQQTLTDEEDVLDGLQKLRVIYPNIMQLEYDNRRTRENPELTAAQAVEQKSEMELFMEFYELQNNQPMSQIQEEFVRNIIREVKE